MDYWTLRVQTVPHGTGSGFIWASAGHVVTNVHVIEADGTSGYPEGAPFEAVLVSAAHPDVPPPLIHQLREGGRLVQPIGPGGNEDVTLFERTADGLRPVRVLTRANFVPLRGKYGFGQL